MKIVFSLNVNGGDQTYRFPLSDLDLGPSDLEGKTDDEIIDMLDQDLTEWAYNYIDITAWIERNEEGE